jgi:hypothetical protein
MKFEHLVLAAAALVGAIHGPTIVRAASNNAKADEVADCVNGKLSGLTSGGRSVAIFNVADDNGASGSYIWRVMRTGPYGTDILNGLTGQYTAEVEPTISACQAERGATGLNISHSSTPVYGAH